MYRVIQSFTDLQDSFYSYRVGEEYPREGAKKPDADRIKSLASKDNATGMVLIEEVKPKKAPARKKKVEG